MRIRRKFALGAAVLLAGLGAWVWLKTGHQSTPARQAGSTAATAARLGAGAQTAASATAAAQAKTGTLQEIPSTPEFWWNPPIREETFARFHDWAQKYLETPSPGGQAELETEGVTLATQRRKELAALIQSDPGRALGLTVPGRVRQQLPAAVVQLLETPVRGRGVMLVSIGCDNVNHEAKPSLVREARLGGKVYRASVCGALGETTQTNVLMEGIALDGAAALQAQAANGGTGGVDGTTPLDQGASSYTEGTKRLILIRVNFPDNTAVPLSDTTAASLISGLSSLYNEMSYGITDFALSGGGSDTTATYMMPQPTAYYTTNSSGRSLLRNDARTAATAGGWNLANYDLDLICMSSISGWTWSGWANIGAAGAWIRGVYTTSNVGHELGHNLGLNHANFWQTTDGSVAGTGTSIEYGDSFDIMGASTSYGHFNGRSKFEYLNWLHTNEMISVTSNNTYRIFALEPTVAPSPGPRALKIVKSGTTNYWVDFKQQFTGNKWLMSGAGLRMTLGASRYTQLLDTTPGSADGKNDSAIVIGRTYADPVAGVCITPIGKGGTTPESLDVVVNLGNSPANVPPTLTLSAPTANASAGATLTFSAAASDANGDALAYYWDFGDRTFGDNSPAASHSWSSAGEYVVRCTASDMKGGQASGSLIVRIGSPTTFRISGVITNAGGAPVQDVRVYVSSTQMAYTDSDGAYSLVNLSSGSYTVSAVLPNYAFTAAFLNPVSVGPSRTGSDFLAVPTGGATPPNIATQPLSQTVNVGATVTFTVGAGGTPPLGYQWRFNGGNIGGATASSYTKANVQLADAGSYSVMISNVAGTATSANAVLTINQPPGITSQPQSQTVIAGANAIFTATANGTSPLYYQWRFNGAGLQGASGSSYTRDSARAADAGSYCVVITNSFGSITSAVATLSVNCTFAADATYGGTVTKTPDQPSYPANSTVTLTASASSYLFASWSGDASGTNNPLTLVLTTNKAITANFTSPVPEIIIDNPAATFSGNWSLDTGATDKYSSDYRDIGSSPSGTATATYRPNFSVAGYYDVYVWYPTISKGLASAQFIVTGADGNITNSVNESSGSGGWLLLTQRNFTRGTNGFLQILNSGQNGKTVVADAVRWVYSATQPVAAPPAITSLIVSDNVATLTWIAIPGKTYQVQYKSRLTDSAWTALAPDVTATGPTASKTDIVVPGARFYRVQAF